MVVRRQRRRCTRRRIGRVSIYLHHGAWWVYYREDDKPVRWHVGPDERAAERIAAEVNSQLTSDAPTLFTFVPVPVSELRDRFLKYHREVLGSSVATVNRYRTATQHLVDYVGGLGRDLKAQDLSVAAFISFLRQRLREMFERTVKSSSPHNYLIRVNRQPVPQDQTLREGDRVSFTPTKIEGA